MNVADGGNGNTIEIVVLVKIGEIYLAPPLVHLVDHHRPVHRDKLDSCEPISKELKITSTPRAAVQKMGQQAPRMATNTQH